MSFDLTVSLTQGEVSSRSQGVAGAWYVLLTRAPSRVFDFNLNEGWKKLTHNREALYSCARACVAARPLSLP
ncbi:MAG TPA: hypothetical protein PKD73_12275 [Burkholderiaceae bacterium]|nr:hypothetical protein [Burkholderiaceae bacterium]